MPRIGGACSIESLINYELSSSPRMFLSLVKLVNLCPNDCRDLISTVSHTTHSPYSSRRYETNRHLPTWSKKAL